jgi:hypothetical protein
MKIFFVFVFRITISVFVFLASLSIFWFVVGLFLPCEYATSYGTCNDYGACTTEVIMAKSSICLPNEDNSIFIPFVLILSTINTVIFNKILFRKKVPNTLDTS